jgi:hypothetical protein
MPHAQKNRAMQNIPRKFLNFMLSLFRAGFWTARRTEESVTWRHFSLESGSFRQLRKVRGGGVKGKEVTNGTTREGKKKSTFAGAGPRNTTGVTRTNKADPTTGFETASQARIEQSFRSGDPAVSQLFRSL